MRWNNETSILSKRIDSYILFVLQRSREKLQTRCRKGDVSKYFISERWKNISDNDSNPQKHRKKDNRQGRGFSLIWDDPVLREAMLKKRRETIERKKQQKDTDEKQI
jgi:hypothetical protein